MTETNDKIAAISDIGLHRKNNEDVAYQARTENGTLLVIADGMGGHRKGEVASKIVVDSLSIPFLDAKHVFNTRRSRKFYAKNLKKANKEIYNLSLSGDEYREMGTTVVSCIVSEKETSIASVGDSRIYILDNDGMLKQISKDQTYVEFLFESGIITKEEMATHPQKNLLLNAVGINPDIADVETFTIANECYQTLFLCSDGLYNMVSSQEIQSVLNDKSKNAFAKAKELLRLALEHGGNDNIAIVIMEK